MREGGPEGNLESATFHLKGLVIIRASTSFRIMLSAMEMRFVGEKTIEILRGDRFKIEARRSGNSPPSSRRGPMCGNITRHHMTRTRAASILNFRQTKRRTHFKRSSLDMRYVRHRILLGSMIISAEITRMRKFATEPFTLGAGLTHLGSMEFRCHDDPVRGDGRWSFARFILR